MRGGFWLSVTRTPAAARADEMKVADLK